MFLSDPPSQSSDAARINGNLKTQYSLSPSREFAIVAAVATGSRSKSVPAHRRNCYSPSSPSSSIPIHLNGIAHGAPLNSNNSNKVGNRSNGLDVVGEAVHTDVEPPQSRAVKSDGIGAPPSPAPSLSEPNSSLHKMEMLSESMKGRMLFAIPKKGELGPSSI